MVCFFRSLDAWQHLAVLDVVSWSVPVYSTGNKTGTVTVAGEDPSLSGCWAILDGMLFYASKAVPAKGSTAVTLRKPIYAFTRDLVYAGNGTETLQTFIAGEIEDNWVDQADDPFAMPYLAVSTSGSTSADLPYANNEVYAFTEILELAEEMGLAFAFTMTDSTLTMQISVRNPQTHNVFFNDGHSHLVSASLTQSLVAKVTARRISVEDDVITVGNTKTFYWHADGTISETPPSPRIPGTWSIVSVTDEDIDLDVAAAEAMSGNVSAVKIVFASDRAFALGDSITCRINGKTVIASVTLATRSSGDPRTRYELGDLPTTLTDKFEASVAQKRAQSVTYENAADTPLSAAGGTVGGNLTVNDSLKASVLAVGSGSYGSSLPATGVIGQVFFKLT